MPFAAAYPERVVALILHESSATWRRTDETPWQPIDEELKEGIKRVRLGPWDRWWRNHNPSLAADESALAWCGRYTVLSITPAGCLADGWRFSQTDVRGLLGTIQVPTLVLLHRTHRPNEAQDSAYLASRIRNGRLVELPGPDHLPWAADPDRVVREVERFLAAVSEEEADLDRVLSTILFTDIVGSTERAAQLGDVAWRQLVEGHHSTVRALLARYRGREIDTAGDGFFAPSTGRREPYAAPRRRWRR